MGLSGDGWPSQARTRNSVKGWQLLSRKRNFLCDSVDKDLPISVLTVAWAEVYFRGDVGPILSLVREATSMGGGVILGAFGLKKSNPH